MWDDRMNGATSMRSKMFQSKFTMRINKTERKEIEQDTPRIKVN